MTKLVQKTNLWTSKNFRENLMKFFIYIVLCLGAVFFLTPFAWMISTSLKIPTQVYIFPPRWIPDPIIWSNYSDLFRGYLPIATFFKNTIFYVIGATVAVVSGSSLVAFGFARVRFKGNAILFLILLSTLMIPPQVTMIPRYILFSHFGWLNTYKPLIIPQFCGNAFLIFLLRQFFMTIPKELDDAARLDGCSIFGIWWRIILPLSKPALGIISIFSFAGTWHDFMGPLIYLDDMDKFPIALGLRAFQTMIGRVDWSPMMALSMLSLLPIMAVFFFAQKYYIQGVTLTGVKG